MAWLRIDDQCVLNSKIGELTDREFRALFALWSICARTKNAGLLNIAEAKHAAYTTPQGARSVTLAQVQRFVDLGLLNSLDEEIVEVNDWQQYQPKDPTKAERQARWRASTETST